MFPMYNGHYEFSSKHPTNEPYSFFKIFGDQVTVKTNLPNYNNNSVL